MKGQGRHSLVKGPDSMHSKAPFRATRGARDGTGSRVARVRGPGVEGFPGLGVEDSGGRGGNLEFSSCFFCDELRGFRTSQRVGRKERISGVQLLAFGTFEVVLVASGGGGGGRRWASCMESPGVYRASGCGLTRILHWHFLLVFSVFLMYVERSG